VASLSEHQSFSNIKVGSDRGFGFVFTIVFVLIGLYPLLTASPPFVWALVVATIFLLIALAKPSILRPLNILWFKFGILLGAIIAPIIMAVVFFIVVTPIGLLLRLFGKDVLDQKIDAKRSSYWIARGDNDRVGTMRDQF